MLLAALCLGALIGLSLGALGGGGSVLTVPVLVYVLDLTAQEATTGSLVIVGTTALLSCVGHACAGHADLPHGLLLAACGVPASLLGTSLNRRVDPDALLLAFAALMLVAATGMLLRARSQPEQEPPAGGGGTATAVRVRPGALLLAGLGIGFLTGFLGVGGGFVIVPVLVVLLRFETHVAVGTSLLVIALNSGVALAARSSHGSFDWSVIVPFTLAAVVASLAGQRLADHVPTRQLSRAFALLLVAVAAYVAVRAVAGLA